MNTSILKKCLEELSKDDPRKDYVIGMLETLIDMAGMTPQTNEITYRGDSNRYPTGIIPERQIEPLTPAEQQIISTYGSHSIGPIATPIS